MPHLITRSRMHASSCANIRVVGICTLANSEPEFVIKPRKQFHNAYAHRLLEYDANVSYHGCVKIGHRRYAVKISRAHSTAYVLHNPIGAAYVEFLLDDNNVSKIEREKYYFLGHPITPEQSNEIKFVPPEERYI